MATGERLRGDGYNQPSLLQNGILNVAGQVARGTVVVLAIPFLIRLLGIAEYGVWSFAYAFLALVTMCEAGFSVAAAVFLSKDLAHDNAREAGHTLTFVIISALLLSCAFASILWFAGPSIARPLTSFAPAERAAAGHAIQMAGIAAAILIFQRTLVGVEQAFNRYALINGLDLVQALLTNLGFLTVAALGGRTVALMKWQVVASVAVLLVHIYVVLSFSRAHRLNFGWNLNKAKEIFRYSLATWSATLGSAAFGQCDRLVVGWILGAPVLGVYSAITNLTTKINTLSATAVQPLVPSLSRELSNGRLRYTRIQQATRLNALLAIGSCISLYLLADWVMKLLGSAVYSHQNILGLQIAAVIYGSYSLTAPAYFILFSLGAVRTNAFVILFSGVLSLALISVGGIHFGLLGALVGNIGYLGTLFLIVAALKRVSIELGRFLAWIAFPLACLAVSLPVGIFLHGYLLWRSIFAVATAILCLLWFLDAYVKAPGLKAPLTSSSEA